MSRLLLLLGLCIAQVAQAAPIGRIIVMPFSVSSGMDAKQGALLDEIYLTELSKVVPPSVKLTGASDVTAMLGQMEQKRLAGCDDTSCLVEIGNAIGASHILSSSVGKMGGRFVVSTKLLSVSDAQVLHRNAVYRTSEEQLIEAVGDLAKALAASQGWAMTAATTARAETAAPAQGDGDRRDSPAAGPGLLLMGGAVAGGVGVLVAVGAGIAWLVLDGMAGDVQRSYGERKGLATAELVGMLGTGLGALVGLGGGAMAAASLLGE